MNNQEIAKIKQEIIEKACEWLESYIGFTVILDESNIEDFRKAMEE